MALQARFRRLLSTAGMLLVAFVDGGNLAWAVTSKVQGSVVDPTGKAVMNATLAVTTPSRRTFGPFALLDGQMAIPVDLGTETRATCVLTAPGYKAVHLSVEIVDGMLKVGTVKLQPVGGIEIRNLTYFPPSGPTAPTSGYVDVLTKNVTKEDALVKEIRVFATRRRQTDCGDVPGLKDYLFEIKSALLPRTGARGDLILDVSTPNGSDKGIVAASGKTERGNCNQIRFDLVIRYPFTVKASADLALRVALPLMQTEAPDAGASKPSAVDLRAWEMLSLELALDPSGTASMSLDP